MRIREHENDSKRRRENVTALQKSRHSLNHSHTVLWHRSAGEIKEEDYTLAERLGSILSVL